MTNRYTGEKLKNGNKDLKLQPYLPSEKLKKAVNLALFLKKPLLLMGEPGVGKTRLAESVAYDFHEGNFKDYFFRWDVKSYSEVKDGLYLYDAIRRLSDAQIAKNKEERKQLNKLGLDEEGSYITRGELAKALKSGESLKKSVVLIDEIDKAPIDFPNDLLNLLEDYTFTIQETGKKILPSEHFEPPLIIITSNKERELPPAFLRRCVYCNINFPDSNLLLDIIKSIFKLEDDKFSKEAIGIFEDLREQMGTYEKKPSTSELIDWFEVLKYCEDKKNALFQEYEGLHGDKIPFVELLLKSKEAQDKYAIKPKSLKVEKEQKNNSNDE